MYHRGSPVSNPSRSTHGCHCPRANANRTARHSANVYICSNSYVHGLANPDAYACPNPNSDSGAHAASRPGDYRRGAPRIGVLRDSGETAWRPKLPFEDNFWASASVAEAAAALGAQPDLSAPVEDRGMTPVHIVAAVNPNPEVMRLLLDHGADVMALNEDGQTPLHLACEFQQRGDGQATAELGG